MLLFLLTVSPAWALMLCTGSSPVDALPRNGAEDVPVDVAPAMVFSASTCGPETPRSAVLTRADDGTEVASVIEDEIDTDALVEVFPEAPLDPLTTYVLTLDDDGREAITAFTTGEGVSATGRARGEVRSRPRGSPSRASGSWSVGRGSTTSASSPSNGPSRASASRAISTASASPARAGARRRDPPPLQAPRSP